MSALLNALPVLGHGLLVGRLPAVARRAWNGAVSPGLAQGLLELEAMDRLEMLPGDDSEATVRLAVGGESRTVRSVMWRDGRH